MKLMIDIDEDRYKRIINDEDYIPLDISCAIKEGEILSKSNNAIVGLLEDGTLVISIDDATKVGRVLVEDDKHNCGMFYRE